MKIFLMYNYNFKDISIYNQKNGTIIDDEKGYRYLLREVSSRDELLEIYNLLIQNNVYKYYNKIVFTKNNDIVSNYKGKYFVLLLLQHSNVINHNRIYLKPINYLSSRYNWIDMWINKNNYYYDKWNILRRKYSIIDDSFDYFFYLAENSIYYLLYSEVDLNVYRPSFTYKRYIQEEFLNPTNIIVDGVERDVGEYLKYIFLNNKYNFDCIDSIFRKNKYSNNQYIKIYARVMYPNYYFDMCDMIENNIDCYKYMKSVIDRTEEFENYLRGLYFIISKYSDIKKVDWL